MIEIKEIASGEYEETIQLLIDGQAVVARSRFSLWDKASLALDDLGASKRLCAAKFSDLPLNLGDLSFRVNFDWSDSFNELEISRDEQSGNFRLHFIFNFQLNNWNRPWTISEFNAEFCRVVESSGEPIHFRPQDEDDEVITQLTLVSEFVSIESQIAAEISRLEPTIRKLNEDVERSLASRVRRPCMDAKKLTELLSSQENPNVEFKLKYDLAGQGKGKNRDEVAKDMIALANAPRIDADDCAYLVIGAGDVLRPDGHRDQEDVRRYNYSRTQFLAIANGACQPSLGNIEYHELELGLSHYGVIVLQPSPFVHVLTRDLDTPRGLWRRNSVLIRHGDQIGVASPPEIALLEKQKKKLAATAGDIEEGGWSGVPWTGKYLAYDGPLEALMLIEPADFQTNMKDVLEGGGFRIRFSKPRMSPRLTDRGFRVVYLTDRKSWRRKIMSAQQELVARLV